MRARVIILVLAILLVAAFAALNWSEFQRTAPLSFGLAVTEAPLGMVMLSMLGIALLAFLLSSAAQATGRLVETRHYSRELERQRELADRAEASRFVDLRTYLDTHLKELRQRDGIAATELEKVRLENQREMRNQMEAMNRLLATRLNELEAHLDARLTGERVVQDRVITEPPLRRERV